MKNIVALLCILSSFNCFANGDPIISYSALTGSANPAPRTITDVQLMSEKLYIRLGKYTTVHVKYVLWNNSDKDYIDIDYGFPVDYTGGKEFENSPLQSDHYSEGLGALGWHDSYIRNISFAIDGQPLASKPAIESTLSKPVTPKRSDFEKGESGDQDYEGALDDAKYGVQSRRWFYTQFSIKRNQSVTLEVTYSIENRRYVPLYSDFAHQASSCNMYYDLSPAQHWGNGFARDLYVQIDTSDLTTSPEFYKNEYNLKFSGMPFERQGDIYSYRTSNFPFKDSHPIDLTYSLQNSITLSELINKRLPNDEYTISTTSEQAKYPISNLSDMDFASAWVTSKNDGIDEKITITLKKPMLLGSIALINGYHKNEKIYMENSRIKELAISIEGGYNENGKIDSYTDTRLWTFEQKEYKPLYFENMATHPAAYYCPLGIRYSKFYTKTIELTIKKVEKGTMYKDLCISEIILFKGSEE